MILKTLWLIIQHYTYIIILLFIQEEPMDPEDTSGFPPIVFPIDTLRFLKKGKQYVFYFDRIKYVEDRTFSDEGNNRLNQTLKESDLKKIQ